MKVNENTAILAEKVLLVPYEAHHVPKYHSWMQDPDIQEATASEPMPLEDEYENQQSWRSSHDKLTFILCAPPTKMSLEDEGIRGGLVRAKVDDADGQMIGDINFFLHPYEAQGTEGENTEKDWVTGEVDIMVAEKSYRGRGVGKAAVTALLCYIHNHLEDILKEHESAAREARQSLELKNLMVKIGEENTGSRALFGKLGFQQRGPVNYFGEVTMLLTRERLPELVWWDDAQDKMREVEYNRE